MATMGYGERFPPARLSAYCRFRKQTITGTRGNDGDAPLAVIRFFQTRLGRVRLDRSSKPESSINYPSGGLAQARGIELKELGIVSNSAPAADCRPGKARRNFTTRRGEESRSLSVPVQESICRGAELPSQSASRAVQRRRGPPTTCCGCRGRRDHSEPIRFQFCEINPRSSTPSDDREATGRGPSHRQR
jgi:hypothetical protein